MTTPGPLKVGVCLHCLDHWTAEDWQEMSRRKKAEALKFQEQVRQERARQRRVWYERRQIGNVQTCRRAGGC